METASLDRREIEQKKKLIPQRILDEIERRAAKKKVKLCQQL